MARWRSAAASAVRASRLLSERTEVVTRTAIAREEDAERAASGRRKSEERDSLRRRSSCFRAVLPHNAGKVDAAEQRQRMALRMQEQAARQGMVAERDDATSPPQTEGMVPRGGTVLESQEGQRRQDLLLTQQREHADIRLSALHGRRGARHAAAAAARRRQEHLLLQSQPPPCVPATDGPLSPIGISPARPTGHAARAAGVAW
eukprot:gene5199-3120_t